MGKLKLRVGSKAGSNPTKTSCIGRSDRPTTVMEEKRILNNGLKINYKVAGQGPVVLILHGWRSSLNTWETVQKILANMGYKVYLLDLPGFGKSDSPPKPWKVSDYTHLF